VFDRGAKARQHTLPVIGMDMAGPGFDALSLPTSVLEVVEVV
jgi:hypothetical protein